MAPYYNLLSIASFRIGVPSILFFSFCLFMASACVKNLSLLVSQFCKKIHFYQNLATISVGLKSVAQGLLHQLQVAYYANIISYIQLSREVACKTLTHLTLKTRGGGGGCGETSGDRLPFLIGSSFQHPNFMTFPSKLYFRW